MTDIQKTHLLKRTSPKGTNFIGTCSLCGRTGLTASQVTEPCDNQRGVSSNNAIVEAILGELGND